MNYIDTIYFPTTRMSLKLILLFSVFAVVVNCKTRIVDLSHLQNYDSIAWPFYKPYNFTIEQRGIVDYLGTTFWLEHNTFFMTEHRGTHIDAPAHVGKGGWRTQQIPVERLMGPGVIINIKEKAKADYDYRITVDDILNYEKKYGKIAPGSIVMMNSGWYHKYPNKTLIFNTNEHENVSTFHFPGFGYEAAKWLVDMRGIYAIGGDTPSFDYGQSTSFPVHILIGKENIIGVENVNNLDKVPESGSTIFLPVLKIDDGSGGPTRVLATFDDDKPSNHGNRVFDNLTLTILFLTITACLNM